MKHKILQAIPSVFSLRNDGDYGRFVVRGGASQMMRNTWVDLGNRLDNAIDVVVHGDDGGEKATYYILGSPDRAQSFLVSAGKNVRVHAKQNSKSTVVIDLNRQANNHTKKAGVMIKSKAQKPKPKVTPAVERSPQATTPILGTKLQSQHGQLGEITRILPGTAPVTQRITQITAQQTSFNGPIPHPEIFRKYGEVIPDAPERILRVFEEDSKHAREIQMEALLAQKCDARMVHWMAWSLIAGGYAMSVLFAWMGKDVLAGLILTTTIIGTVTGFLQGKKNNSSENEENQSE